MLDSTLHKGPGQAGNKSLLSYRAGHAVTGYVGFIPSSESIPIPVKDGPGLRAGPEANKDRGQPEWILGSSPNPETTYQASINRSFLAKGRPQTTPVPVTPVGPVEEGMDAQADSFKPGPKFVACSTYRDAFAPVNKDNLYPIPQDGRRKPAYLGGTTYALGYENGMEIALGVGWLAKKNALIKKEPAQFSDGFKEVTMQREPPISSYTQSFGEFGRGMPGQLPPPGRETYYAEYATTRDLFAGTTKAFARAPGYGGFLPASVANARAVKQSYNNHAHTDPKDCRLFTLNQFLHNPPGAGCFHPRDAFNLMAEPKGRAGTTTAFNNAHLSSKDNLAEIARKRSLVKTFGTVQGTAEFFQEGQVTVSENGKKNAEAFYKLLRPFEGLPRMSRMSQLTESGYRFDCYSGRVH